MFVSICLFVFSTEISLGLQCKVDAATFFFYFSLYPQRSFFHILISFQIILERITSTFMMDYVKVYNLSLSKMFISIIQKILIFHGMLWNIDHTKPWLSCQGKFRCPANGGTYFIDKFLLLILNNK